MPLKCSVTVYNGSGQLYNPKMHCRMIFTWDMIVFTGYNHLNLLNADYIRLYIIYS